MHFDVKYDKIELRHKIIPGNQTGCPLLLVTKKTAHSHCDGRWIRKKKKAVLVAMVVPLLILE